MPCIHSIGNNYCVYIRTLSLAEIPVSLCSFLVPYYSGNITKSLVPEMRNRRWSALNGPQQVVMCHGDDGHQFDGFPCDDNVCVPLHWVCDRDTDCEGKYLVLAE
jgi:hypothetical protein